MSDRVKLAFYTAFGAVLLIVGTSLQWGGPGVLIGIGFVFFHGCHAEWLTLWKKDGCK